MTDPQEELASLRLLRARCSNRLQVMAAAAGVHRQLGKHCTANMVRAAVLQDCADMLAEALQGGPVDLAADLPPNLKPAYGDVLELAAKVADDKAKEAENSVAACRRLRTATDLLEQYEMRAMTAHDIAAGIRRLARLSRVCCGGSGPDGEERCPDCPKQGK